MLYVLKDRLILIIYIYVREIVYERIYVMKFYEKNWSQGYCVQSSPNTSFALSRR